MRTEYLFPTISSQVLDLISHILFGSTQPSSFKQVRHVVLFSSVDSKIDMILSKRGRNVYRMISKTECLLIEKLLDCRGAGLFHPNVEPQSHLIIRSLGFRFL